jgi:Flp pilus assembly protein TadD
MTVSSFHPGARPADKASRAPTPLPPVVGKMPANRRALFACVLALSAASALSGCARDRMSTGSVNPAAQGGAQLERTIAGIGAAYQKNPSDKATAITYAEALRADGRNDQALAVMRKLAIELPKDRDVLSAYGKSLASAGELKPALDAIRRAQSPEQPDWKLLSAEGAILDQLGEAATARELYRKALDIRPDEPSVLSNLGMSYVLEGDLRSAETYLRSALEKPGADNKVRQNLALVVGLQGRFDEAEQIAAQALSPQEAQSNIAYLRQMLSQQNSWAELDDKAKQKPEG